MESSRKLSRIPVSYSKLRLKWFSSSVFIQGFCLIAGENRSMLRILSIRM